MSRLFPLLAAFVAVLLLGGAAPAQARPGQIMLFDAPRDLLRPDARAGALAELESLGVRELRLVVYWKDVAPAAGSKTRPAGDPSDPAFYTWGEYDAVMAAAGERGWPVVVTPTTPGPRWAMKGRRDQVTRPNRTLFGQFITALSRRYGAQVTVWSVGNEPNHPDFLRPQYSKKGHRPVSPGIYRGLFLAAQKALDATGNGGDTLLMGETAPRGTGRVVAPITFMRGALCLNGRYRKRKSCKRVGADGWAHHPYTTKTGPFFRPPGKNDVTIGVLSRLTRALDRAGRARAIRRRMPIWLTEFGVQSTPDRFFGVSLARQNEFRAIGERIAYASSRVKAFSQYLLTDDPPIEGVAASARYGGFESGLRFANGRAKPSLKGFRLTLSALRSGSRVSLWGVVRPATAAVQADVLVKDEGRKAFRRLKTITTNRRGAFSLRTAFRKGRVYRLRWDGQTSPSVRVYRR